jgi:hypothetical protein
MKNDEIGDCTIAAAGHLIMGWSSDAGKDVQSKKDIPTELDKQKRVMVIGLVVVGTIVVGTIVYVIFKKTRK